MAEGVYQLPLFKGLPSMALLVEMKRTGDVETTLLRALKVRPLHTMSTHIYRGSYIPTSDCRFSGCLPMFSVAMYMCWTLSSDVQL